MFKVPKPILTLGLINNTDDVVPASLLCQANPFDLSNQGTVYKWNITGVSYAIPTATIVFWSVFNPAAIVSRTGTFPVASAQGLVMLLNSFGIGNFFLSTVGGSTFIKTASDSVVYNSLTIGGASMTVIKWGNLSSDSSLQILANAVIIINNAAPPPAGAIVPVNNGDAITGSYVFGAGPPGNSTITIKKELILPPGTITTIFSDNGSSFGGVITPFVIDANYIYIIALTTP